MMTPEELLEALEKKKADFEEEDCALGNVCDYCNELLFKDRGCQVDVRDKNGMALYEYLHDRLSKMVGPSLMDWPNEV
jgi:hypothetical protein